MLGLNKKEKICCTFVENNNIMKCIFTTIILVLSTFVLFAQSEILIKDHQGNIVNGQTITVQGNIALNFNSAIIYFYIQNNTSASLDVRCRKEEISVIPNTMSDICWNTTCYPSNTFSAPPYTLAAGATTDEAHKFTAHYYCQGNSGTTSMRYYFFVSGGGPESYVNVDFVVNSSSVNYNTLSATSVYPNPADGFFYIDAADVEGAKLQVEVYNMIGRKILDKKFQNNNNLVVDCSTWEKGVYFVRLYSDGILMKTSKLTKK